MSVTISKETLIEILTEQLPQLLEEEPALRSSLFQMITQSFVTKKDAEVLQDEFREFREETRENFRQVNERFKEVDKRFDEVDKRFVEVDKRFDEVDKRFIEVDKRFAEVDKRFDAMDKRFDKVDKRLDRLESDVRDLKGSSHERFYRDKASGLFGRYIRRGQDVTNDVADQLYEALEDGRITGQELDQVLAADLLWGGTLRTTKEAVVLVLEASWRAEVNDVERASERAETLRQIGLKAIGVVGGKEWDEEAKKEAREKKVVMTTNGRINKASWKAMEN